MSENLKVKMGLSEDGADKRRKASEYLFKNVTWFIRSGALNVGFMKTDIRVLISPQPDLLLLYFV